MLTGEALASLLRQTIGVTTTGVTPMARTEAISFLTRVSRAIGRFHSILMALWFVEEVAEITWAWYMTLSGFWKKKPKFKELPKPKGIDRVIADKFFYDGKVYGFELTLISGMDRQFSVILEWEDKKVTLKFSRRGEDKRFVVEIRELPVEIKVTTVIPPTEFEVNEVLEKLETREAVMNMDELRDMLTTRHTITWTFTFEDFKDGWDIHHSEVLGNMIQELRELINQYDDALRYYATLVREWIDDDYPTWYLIPQLEETYKLANELADKIQKKIKEILDYRHKYLPDVKLRLPKHSPVPVPHWREFPERRAWKLKLEKVWSAVEEYYTRILNMKPEIEKIIAQLRTDLVQLDRMYLPKIAKLQRQIEEAKAEGEAERIPELQLQLDNLIKEYEARKNEIRKTYIDKFRDTLARFQQYVHDFNLAVQTYTIMVTPDYEKLLKFIAEVKVKV